MSKKLPGLQRINRPKVGDRSASASEEVRGSEKKKNTDKPSPSKETATVSRKKRKPKNASHSLYIAPSQSERINPLKAEKIIPPKQPADDPANSKKSQVIDQNDKLRLQNHKAKQIITRYAAMVKCRWADPATLRRHRGGNFYTSPYGHGPRCSLQNASFTRHGEGRRSLGGWQHRAAYAKRFRC